MTLPSPLVDLSGILEPLSEPVVKLLDTVSSAIGTIYRPRQIVKEAEAEARALLIKGKASLDLQELAQRTEERISYRELRRQRHIDAIVTQAAHLLPDSVSPDPVDPDWTAHFFNNAQDVSSEEMQNLWAQILVGEVAEPDTYSLYTLDIVRSLRASDAEIFRRACTFVWNLNGGLFHLRTQESDELLAENRFYFGHWQHLEALGLLSAGAGGVIRLEPGNFRVLSYLGYEHSFANPTDPPLDRYLQVYSLTQAGQELAPLCDNEPDFNYVQCLIDSLTSEGIEITPPDPPPQ